MDVHEISGNSLPLRPSKNSRTKSDQPPTVRSDKAELSDEARSLFEATKKMDEIREKIDKGFYLQKDVTESIADAVLKEIKAKR